MATTIRDVVVKLNIEQAQATLKPPELAPAQQAIDSYSQTTLQVINQIEASWADNKKAINDVKSSVDSLSQTLTSQHNSAIEAAKQAVEQYKQTTQEMVDRIIDGWHKVDDAIDGATDTVVDTTPRIQEASSGIVDANMKTLDSFKQAGEGAFTLARGIAFLNSSSEKDFQQTLLVIAKFQGAFDLFKGGTDTIRGLVEASKVLTTSMAAQSVAQAAVGTSATAAAGGLTLMQVAMGPIGIALAAITAVVGIFLYTWSKVKEETEKNTKAWQDATRSVEGLRRAKDLLNTADSQNRISELRGPQQQMQDLEQQVVATRNTIRSLGTEIRRARNQQDTFTDPTIQSQQTAKELAGRLDLNEAIQLRRNQEEGILSLQNRQSQEAEKQYEKQLQTLEVLRDKLKHEEQRLQSMDAQFASLNGIERKELEILSLKAESGKLTREELLTLQKLGGSAVAGFVGNQLGAMGQAQGSRDIFARFGVDTGQERARMQTEVESIGAGAGASPGQTAEQAVQAKLEQLIAQRTQANERVSGLLSALLEAEQINNGRIDELRAKFERNTR